MKGTVLVVDDMPIIRDPIAATLSAAGFEALRAGDGRQALDMLRSQRVDLILLDVNMPVMDGLACLRVLRANPLMAGIPVIMLSGAEDRKDVLLAAKFGIQGYILKSHFSLKDLLTRVTQHFSNQTPSAGLIEPKSQAPVLSASSSTCAPGRSTDGSSPQGADVVTNSAPATSCRSNPSRMPGEIPSLMDREQCIERAKRALQGRTLSGIVADVIALATSPRGDASDLTAMIGRDPLLAARVLQVANSSAFAATRGAVSTLAEAVRNIGCAAVRNIASALGVLSAMPVSDVNGLNLIRCWQHAFAVATLSAHFATERDAGSAYLVGLCHDLGEILFHGQFAEEYQQVLEIQQSTGRPREELEKIMLGMSHGEVIRTIVKCLDLPDAISTPIQEYHAKGPAGSGGSPLTRLLRVADFYANGMLLASSNQSPVQPITCAEAKAVTGHDNPPVLDRVAMRGEIIALSATLSRFSEKQQSDTMAAPYPRRPIRIWLARDPAFSSLDPLEAALDLLGHVKSSNILPNVVEADALVVTARNTSSPGFSSAESTKAATRPNGTPLPILWLVGRANGELGTAVPYPWPIPLEKLAQFIAAVEIP